MIFTVQVRRGTAAAWTAANPILHAGEPGWESDTGKIKIGDGATTWNSLGYSFGAYTDEQAQDAVGTILDDAGDVDFTYDDATPKITAVVKAGTITFAKMQAISADVLLGNDSAGTTVQEITCTAFARTFLDDANAAAVRATIGAGTSSFDGAYGSLSGIPSTFAPSAHHTSHETGGSDPLAALAGSVITTGTVAAARLPTLDALTAPAADVSINTHKLTNVVNPTAPQDGATKDYVDTALAALAEHQEVKYATTVALTELSYTNNGGVGDLLTIVTGVLLIDGQAMTVGDRVLIKNQVNAAHNGIWTVTTVGIIGVSPVFTRATDFDQEADGIAGALVFVLNGTSNDDTRWECSVSGVVTWGTTNLNWSQFLGGVYTADETSLHLSGTTFGILSTWTGQAAITTLGTIGTGVWQGTAVAAAYLGAHASRHQSGGADPIKLDDLAATDDNTDLNVSTTAHGLAPKLPNDAAKYLDGTGAFSTPAATTADLVPQQRAPTANIALTAGQYVYVAGYLTIAAGKSLTIAAGARVDVAN